MTTRSTAPIALLIAGGLVCLAATTVLTPTTEVHESPPVTRVGEQVSDTVTSTTDPLLASLALALLALAAASFLAAGWLAMRRTRLKRAARPQP
jgi:hypothetical protein